MRTFQTGHGYPLSDQLGDITIIRVKGMDIKSSRNYSFRVGKTQENTCLGYIFTLGKIRV